MASFHDLPIEIILHIINPPASISVTGDRTNTTSLCNLRLASKQFNTLICPILFANLHLNFEPLRCSRCLEIIKALANRSTDVFDNTKRLHISTRQLYWTEEHQRKGISVIKKIIADKIYDAISNLKHLISIEYQYSPRHDPEQLAIGVIRALGTLPSIESFEHLRIFSNPPSSFTLRPISDLTKIRIHWSWDNSNICLPEIASLLARCPRLTEMNLRSENYSTDAQDTSLHDIFAEVKKSGVLLKLRRLELSGVLVDPTDFEAYTRHFKDLTFLGIINNPSSGATTAFGAFCNILQNDRIYLKGVVTDFSEDPLLLSYLSSYSGLTELSLGLQENKADSTVVTRVYTQILPLHRRTLEHIELGSVRSLSWCQPPTLEQAYGLIECQQLRVLKVRTTVVPELLERSNESLLGYWYDIGMQFPNLTLLHITPRNVSFFSKSWNNRKKWVAERYRQERGMKFRVG